MKLFSGFSVVIRHCSACPFSWILLISTLHRAVTLEEMDDVTVFVSQQLHLNMAYATDQLLQVGFIIADGGSCLLVGGGDGIQQVLLFLDRAHPTATPALGCLEHHRVTDILNKLDSSL